MSRMTVRWSMPIIGLLIAGSAGCVVSEGNRREASDVRETNERTQSAFRRAPADYSVPKQIRYSFTLHNRSARLIEKTEFWTYAPVPQTGHQWVERVSATQRFRVSHDAMGNEILHFELEQIPPYGTRIVSITTDLRMAEKSVIVGSPDAARFKLPEPYIESNDSILIDVAKTLRTSSPTTTVQRAFDWVSGSLTAETYIPEDMGAAYALAARKGDCTEFAYLLTALSRANDIPARPVGGYVFRGNAIVKPADYHNWTEFLADGSWQIADAQKQAFMKHQTDYVTMRIIASGSGGPLASSHRYAHASSDLDIQMN